MATQLIQFTPYVCLFPSFDEQVNLHANAALDSLISQVILITENDEKNEDCLIRKEVSDSLNEIIQYLVINAVPPTYIVCDDTKCSPSESLTNYISQLESTRSNNNPNQNDMEEMFIELVEPSYTPIFSPSSDEMDVPCDHISNISTSHMSKFVTTSDLTATSHAPTNLSNNSALLNDAAVNSSVSNVASATDMLAPAVLAHTVLQAIQRTPEAPGMSVEALENDYLNEQIHDMSASIDVPLMPSAPYDVIATPTGAFDAVPNAVPSLPTQVDSATATAAVIIHDQIDPIAITTALAHDEVDSKSHTTTTTATNTNTPAPDTTAIFESLAAEIDQMLYEQKSKVEIHAEKKARTTLLTLQHNTTTKSSILQHIEASLVEYSEIYEKAMLFKLYWEAEKAQWQQDNDKIWQDKLAEILLKQQQQQQSQHQPYYMSYNNANYLPCERCGYTATATAAGMYGQNDLYTHDLQHETADKRTRSASHASLALFDTSHPSAATSQWATDAAFEYDLPSEQDAVTVLTPPNQSDVMTEAPTAATKTPSTVKPQLPSRPFVIPNKKRSVSEMLDLSTPKPAAPPTATPTCCSSACIYR